MLEKQVTTLKQRIQADSPKIKKHPSHTRPCPPGSGKGVQGPTRTAPRQPLTQKGIFYMGREKWCQHQVCQCECEPASPRKAVLLKRSGYPRRLTP